ncbi:hypothetical protein M440DRAFT_182016 [Trichoderma longibrachiatum ATCC 18648]|uniref:Transmembrane protein n=1 Tax=Trichoderma longibrachiatum ATCC 18648 TaxID=983965 RepID=A0A2T4CF29_TRILO|nr:hypothetical protein M440DRAFT_182016 [Trichoderma longibrachiatum ATCC 18648]
MTTAFHAHITSNRQEGCSLIQPYLPTFTSPYTLVPPTLFSISSLFFSFLFVMTTSLTRPRLSSVVTGCSAVLSFRLLSGETNRPHTHMESIFLFFSLPCLVLATLVGHTGLCRVPLRDESRTGNWRQEGENDKSEPPVT